MKKSRLIGAILGIILILLLAAASIIIKAKFNEDILQTFDILKSINPDEG